MLSLETLDLQRVDWDELDAYPDRVIFQTREWLEFLSRTQSAEPVIAAVRSDGRHVGYFTGLVIRRYGVRILGSPFPGWTTDSMGFNLADGVSRREAAASLPRYAFRSLRCLHLELKDRLLTTEDLAGLDYHWTQTTTFEIDLAPPEEEVFGRMNSACRRAIRKAEKNGVTIEEATGEGFAEEYYAQLIDVFAKQDLRPTYGVDRVRELIRCLHPTGRLLLLRAVAPDGTRIATGIFPAHGRTAYFWGGASWRSHQILRPNEALFWYAMRYWRERGATILDMGGGGDYKRRYGPEEVRVPFFRQSRVRGLEALREVARRRSSLPT